MNIYLAAAFSEQERMRTIRSLLNKHGHAVTSRWLDEDREQMLTPWHGDVALYHMSLEQNNPEAIRVAMHLYRAMYQDLEYAHAMVWYPGGKGHGGRFVEFGLALGWDKSIIVVGHVETPMQMDPFIDIVDDDTDVLINAIARTERRLKELGASW